MPCLQNWYDKEAAVYVFSICMLFVYLYAYAYLYLYVLCVYMYAYVFYGHVNVYIWCMCMCFVYLHYVYMELVLGLTLFGSGNPTGERRDVVGSTFGREWSFKTAQSSKAYTRRKSAEGCERDSNGRCETWLVFRFVLWYREILSTYKKLAWHLQCGCCGRLDGRHGWPLMYVTLTSYCSKCLTFLDICWCYHMCLLAIL